MEPADRIGVIGLGYVGLSLALAFARIAPVVGYDRDGARVAALRRGEDRSGEVTSEALGATTARFTDQPFDLKDCNVYLIAVQTPVDAAGRPDLAAVRTACDCVARFLSPGDLVVVELTLWPGATEEFCLPVLEAGSGLHRDQFHLGYSPERLNPGDPEHGLAEVIKLVAGTTQEATARVEALYSPIIRAGVQRTPDVRTAEAAKLLENAQRDVGIAFANEAAATLHAMGLDARAVFAAAETKWNFVAWRPGLVGGPCIGVDSCYLLDAAGRAGAAPGLLGAARAVNEATARHVATRVSAALGSPGRVLVLGLTFKPDSRSVEMSGVFGLVEALAGDGHQVRIYDPLAPAGAHPALDTAPHLEDADAMVIAMPHQVFGSLVPKLAARAAAGGIVFDTGELLQSIPGVLRL